MYLQRLNNYSIKGKVPINCKGKIKYIAIGVAFLYLVAVFFSLLRSVSGSQDPNIQETTNRIVKIPLWSLVPLVIGPILEEILFRKIVLKKLIVRIGTIWSVLLSSFLFSILHLDIFLFPYFINSVIYSILYLKTNDLKVPILAHIIYNFTALTLMFI